MKNVLMFTYAYAPSFQCRDSTPFENLLIICLALIYSPTIITAEFFKNVKDEEGIYRIRNDILECELNGGVKALLLRLTRRDSISVRNLSGAIITFGTKSLKYPPKILNNESPDHLCYLSRQIEPVMLGIAASKKSFKFR